MPCLLLEMKAIQLAEGGAGGGGGGLLGGILNAVLGAAASAAGGAGAGGGINPDAGASAPRYAHGGTPPVGQFSLVGEAGPELAFFGSPARIFSNTDLKELIAGGASNQGTRPVNVTMNISTPDAGTFRRSQSQVSAEIGRMIRQGQARQT